MGRRYLELTKVRRTQIQGPFEILSSSYFEIFSKSSLIVVTLLCYRILELTSPKLHSVTDLFLAPSFPLASLRQNTIPLDGYEINLFSFYILVRTCTVDLSMPALFHLTQYPPNSSVLLQMKEFHSFFYG